MTNLEIACVIVGLIGMLLPIKFEVKTPVPLADILVTITVLVRFVIFGLMIILPLYFRLWS